MLKFVGRLVIRFLGNDEGMNTLQFDARFTNEIDVWQQKVGQIGQLFGPRAQPGFNFVEFR